MIQEILIGPEYGYDLFGDADFKPISVYCKEKLAMRAGETDKAISTADPKLIEFGRSLLESMKLLGPADVDVILTDDGPKLLEINPRFGGGYPCAHLAGADFCKKIIAMRKGESLNPDIGNGPDGVCMLKQDEIIRPDWDISK
jgi:carbamoyl-phosphate synthase large subunit